MEITAFDPDGASDFAGKWLPAWTGNRPEYLVSFYTADAFYADPAVPQGVRGREQLLAYFRKLLSRNPNWVWLHRGSIPLADGFLNRWHAVIPVGDRAVEVDGVCTVQLRQGLIYSNEVFFDRAELLRAIAEMKGDTQGRRRVYGAWRTLRDTLRADPARGVTPYRHSASPREKP